MKHLFEPLKIRNIEIRNRILSTGHQTYLAKNNRVSDDLIAYHEARAKGGVGLIITEAARFHESALTQTPEIQLLSDEGIEDYRRLAEAVHRHGAKIFSQLSHAGRCSARQIDGVREVVYAPSAVPDHRFHTMPREMPEEMVAEIIEACGAGARRLAEAGVDGLELMASHGLLFAQFLNPYTNRRNDAYGGDFERRLRPLADCLRLAREAFGQDRVVGLRISADEVEEGGMDAVLVRDIIRALTDQGLIDYVNTTFGSMAGLGGSIHVVPPMEIAHGYLAEESAAIKSVTKLPVFVAGRINQPQLAEEILAAGKADLCGMTRALITDPELPNKTAEGKFDDIKACIGCNQGCIGHFHQGASITCIQNPWSGREKKLPAPQLSRKLKSVLVAGGGPGGMKAAVVAADCGHEVRLFEAGAKLGGQANLAALLPHRSEFGGLVTNLLRDLELARANIYLNQEVTLDLVAEMQPDEILVATGSTAYWPTVEGEDDAHVIDAHQLLACNVNVGSSVLVADWRCDWVGIGIAEKLAAEGRHVRLAVNGLHPGQELQPYLRDQLAAQLHKAQVEIIPYARLFGLDNDTAYLTHIASGEPIILDNVDTTVLAYGGEANRSLEQKLRRAGIAHHLIGDCLSPRTAEEAILEGTKTALAL